MYLVVTLTKGLHLKCKLNLLKLLPQYYKHSNLELVKSYARQLNVDTPMINGDIVIGNHCFDDTAMLPQSKIKSVPCFSNGNLSTL